MFWQTIFKHFPVKGHFFFFSFLLFLPSQHIMFLFFFLFKTYKLTHTCTIMHSILIEADLTHKKTGTLKDAVCTIKCILHVNCLIMHNSDI